MIGCVRDSPGGGEPRQGACALRVHRGEQRGHHAAFVDPEEGDPLDAGVVEHGEEVGHPRFQVGLTTGIGQARAASVVHQEPREGRPLT